VEKESERQQLVGLIQENSQKLLQIVDNVMAISRIESGKEPLVKSSFELNELLHSMATFVAPLVQAGVEVSVQPASEKQTVTTDAGRLTAVLEHLLTNAAKFTSQGSIVIGYDTPVSKRIRIWVRDTGRGIAPEHSGQVFERFFKVDEYIPGTGLGLSICRMMVASMGGDIGVRSELGEGSTFWLEIPVE
jgi:signal transduction histidine kinase